MNGWTTQSPGVEQEPQEAQAAESDTAFREPVVASSYQAQEGDTETPWFFLSLQVLY